MHRQISQILEQMKRNEAKRLVLKAEKAISISRSGQCNDWRVPRLDEQLYFPFGDNCFCFSEAPRGAAQRVWACIAGRITTGIEKSTEYVIYVLYHLIRDRRKIDSYYKVR